MTGHSAAPADVVADLAVVGGGLIGLAIAAAAADHGLSVALFAVDRPGAASRAAAGLLVPHYGGEQRVGLVARFMTAGRDLYPPYVDWVEERSGIRVSLSRDGAIEYATSAAECAVLQAAAPPDAIPLTADALRELEPALAPTAGGVLHPRDGAVDNVRLTDALASIVAADGRVRTLPEAATRLTLADRAPTVVGAKGTRVQGDRVVLAAGAWAPGVQGLPRRLPVRPLRGQLCTLPNAPLRHVVLGPNVYLATRAGDRTLVGSTMEDVGFDASTSTGAIARLRAAAASACPALGGASVIEAWSGLRPVTPDLLPILGPDPDCPRVIYACGHSRNGILLAPITARVIAALAARADPGWDLSPFAVDRFGANRRPSN